MWFKNLIQGGKATRGGYLSKLEQTFSDPRRESAMAYWERLQGHSKIREWNYEKSRIAAAAEEEEDDNIKKDKIIRRREERTLMMDDEEEDAKKLMPRIYMTRRPKIIASRQDVYQLLYQRGFTNRLGRAEASLEFLELEDEEIVRYYGDVARGILDYFKCCDNFKEIKPYVDYHVRFSCLYTLAKKYDEHPQLTYKRFSKELLVPVEDEQGQIVEKQYYPSSHEIRKMIKGYSNKSLIDLRCAVK